MSLENGAEDINDEEDCFEITCPPEAFFSLKASIPENLTIELAEVQMLPSSRIELSGSDAESLMKLIDALEDLDDVMDVYTNADFGESAGE